MPTLHSVNLPEDQNELDKQATVYWQYKTTLFV